jgi:predicted nucleic acid-binding protein
MILIDTGVWIDFLAGRETPETEIVSSILNEEESIVFTSVILQELMQGCADDASADAIENHFEPFIEVFPQRSTFKLAAKLFRECRSKGFTIRSSVDCLIAACAIEHDCFVHHKDRDFTFIEKVYGLKVLKR